MKKIYLKPSSAYEDYIVPDNFRNNNNELYILSMALDPYDYYWIQCDIIHEKGFVSIWSLDSFKEQAELEFNTIQEEDIFEDEYDKYYDKRWDEMPIVRIAIPDWEVLQEQWKKIKEEKPQYVIFILDDSGALDKIDIIGKNELSDQDKEDMQREHEKYLKYKKAEQKYIDNHPDYSEVWRGPQDDEYEADIMKYYDYEEKS